MVPPFEMDDLEKIFDATSNTLVDETFELSVKSKQEKAVLPDGDFNLPVLLESASTFIDNGELKLAKKIYSKILKIEQTDPKIFDGLASCYFLEANDAYALDCLGEAIKLEPTLERYTKLIRTLVNLGEMKKAISSINEVLKLEMKLETRIEFLRTSSECRFRLNDFEAALFTIQEALNLKDNVSLNHSLKGHILTKLGHLFVAKDSFDKALELEAENASAWYGLGTIFKEQKKAEECLEALEISLEIDPENFNVLTLFVEAAIEFDQAQSAEKVLKNCLEKAGESPKIIYCLIMVCYKLEKFDEALNFCTVIESDEEHGDAVKELQPKILRKRDRVRDTKREHSIS